MLQKKKKKLGSIRETLPFPHFSLSKKKDVMKHDAVFRKPVYIPHFWTFDTKKSFSKKKNRKNPARFAISHFPGVGGFLE